MQTPRRECSHLPSNNAKRSKRREENTTWMKMCNEKKKMQRCSTTKMQEQEVCCSTYKATSSEHDQALSIHSLTLWRGRTHDRKSKRPVRAKLLSPATLFTFLLRKAFASTATTTTQVLGKPSALRSTEKPALRYGHLSWHCADWSALPTIQNNHIRAAAGLPTVPSENFSAYHDSPQYY